MLSSDTTKEPEGEIFEIFTLHIEFYQFLLFWEITWKLFLVEDNWTTESTTSDQNSDLEDLYDR